MYCSKNCRDNLNREKPKYKCFECTKTFQRSQVCHSNKTFCSRSCSVTYHNRINPKRTKQNKKQTKLKINKKRVYTSNSKKISSIWACANKTKGEIFSKSKSWQAARSCIQRHSRRVYEESNQPKQCALCKYNKHVQIAHRVAVSEFPNETLISKINHIDNLIALCPNHHWEYDHNNLQL